MSRADLPTNIGMAASPNSRMIVIAKLLETNANLVY